LKDILVNRATKVTELAILNLIYLITLTKVSRLLQCKWIKLVISF